MFEFKQFINISAGAQANAGANAIANAGNGAGGFSPHGGGNQGGTSAGIFAIMAPIRQYNFCELRSFRR